MRKRFVVALIWRLRVVIAVLTRFGVFVLRLRLRLRLRLGFLPCVWLRLRLLRLRIVGR
jgi:hypothetical protein